MRRILGLTIAAFCVIPQLCEAKTRPGGRIRVICFGDVIEQYGGFNSYVVINTDPAIAATLVPSRGDFLGSYKDATRNMRMYMPRSYSLLTSDYDLIFTSDADRAVFDFWWTLVNRPKGFLRMLSATRVALMKSSVSSITSTAPPPQP